MSVGVKDLHWTRILQNQLLIFCINQHGHIHFGSMNATRDSLSTNAFLFKLIYMILEANMLVKTWTVQYTRVLQMTTH